MRKAANEGVRPSRDVVRNDLIQREHPLQKLPVARALWKPEPNLKRAAMAWLSAAGAHHTALSRALAPEYLRDFAEIGIESLLIDGRMEIDNFRRESRCNEMYYRLSCEI